MSLQFSYQFVWLPAHYVICFFGILTGSLQGTQIIIGTIVIYSIINPLLRRNRMNNNNNNCHYVGSAAGQPKHWTWTKIHTWHGAIGIHSWLLRCSACSIFDFVKCVLLLVFLNGKLLINKFQIKFGSLHIFFTFHFHF